MDLWMNLKVFVNKCMNSESVLMIPSSVLSLFLSISFILSLSLSWISLGISFARAASEGVCSFAPVPDRRQRYGGMAPRGSQTGNCSY